MILPSIAERLAPVSGDCATAEAERILTFLLDCRRTDLFLKPDKTPGPELIIRIDRIISERLSGKPLAYILGSAYFYNREFLVTPDVLIPRPDTEILIEEILKNEPSRRQMFLDIGTGSGCIAAILTGERKPWRAVATDRSRAALAIARKNCSPAVSFLCSDMLSSVKPGYLFDFIVSNPPYIASPLIGTLSPSVKYFEPHCALDGGSDGLDYYRVLSTEAPKLLKDKGRIYCETGYDQGTSVPDIFHAAGWQSISVTKDLGNNDRVLRATRNENQ
ncbi:MAG: peptide chain release factor N(5)-glutamine methyltransferase [Chitinispirillaceae bacterium]|jgi:release factor glutamine methyltransferase|nr:peptide chain release factor N(5)-glutamine methyltransferase [Chitinispirillaceae bacterium]